MLIMRNGKRQITEEKDQPNQEKIKMLREKENYKYLGILEANTIKQVEMKEKIKNNYFGRKDLRTRKLMKIHKALHHIDDID